MIVPQFPITRAEGQDASAAAFVGAALGAFVGALAQQPQGGQPGQLELLQRQNELLQQQNAALVEALAQLARAGQGAQSSTALIPVLRRR